jgi:hypothetical protein
VWLFSIPSKLVWAEIESIYSLDINCTHNRITASQEHLLELEKTSIYMKRWFCFKVWFCLNKPNIKNFTIILIIIVLFSIIQIFSTSCSDKKNQMILSLVTVLRQHLPGNTDMLNKSNGADL